MRRKGNTLLKAVLSFITLLSAMPVFSVHAENSYDPVTGEKVTIEKYLIYANTGNAPTVTFNYEITPAEGLPSKDKKYEVISGGDPSVTGTPVIGTASFTPRSAKYSTAQSDSSSIGKYIDISKDPVELTASDAYSKSDIDVDFTNVTFSKPGIFRWKITEVNSADQESKGIVPVGEQVKYLDVYIECDTYSESTSHGTLKIEGYILQNKEGYQPPLESADDVIKTVGFTSRFNIYPVSLRNAVSGNQGSLNKYFEYTWKIEGAIPNSEYDITYINADKIVPDKTTDKVTKREYRGKENPLTVKTDGKGTAEFKGYLKAGQKIVINGISENAKITITQTAEDGYYVEHEASPREPGNSVYIDPLLIERNVTFYNEKNGAIPTGIIQNEIPGLLLVMSAMLGIYGTFRIRKENR